MTEIHWQWKQFQQFSVNQLFDVLKLRQEVFVIEQNCVYPDIDDIDKIAWHLLGSRDKQLCTYLRVYLEPSESNSVRIGRILTSKEIRSSGVGKQLMGEVLNFIAGQYPESKTKISAQVQLEKFYKQFSFITISEPYAEDGIMHVDMEKTS